MSQSFFTELQDREKEFGIADIQLGLTTLEEVFLNIARQADLETAAAEGRLVPLTLTTSGVSVEVSPIHCLFFLLISKDEFEFITYIHIFCLVIISLFLCIDHADTSRSSIRGNSGNRNCRES